MILKKIHVKNFRSIEDSLEFDLGQVLCLVGKNEAGKTAVVQALTALNPHPSTPMVYDRERDYPRRWLTEYEDRNKDAEALVVPYKNSRTPVHVSRRHPRTFGRRITSSDEPRT